MLPGCSRTTRSRNSVACLASFSVCDPTVTASSGSGSGTLGLNLVDNDTIIDANGNKLGGAGAGNGSFTGAVYTLDRTAPTVTAISRAAANPTSADTVSWTVTFSESVTGVDSSSPPTTASARGFCSSAPAPSGS